MWRKVILFGVCMLGCWTPCVAEPILQYSKSFSTQLQQQIDAQSDAQQMPMVIPVLFTDAKGVYEVVKGVYGSTALSCDPRRNAIVAVATVDMLQKIKRLVKRLDQKHKLVRFEIKILEVSSEWMERAQRPFATFGDATHVAFDWNKNAVVSDTVLGAYFEEMVTSGHAKLLAKPTLTTLDCEKSSVKVGELIPYLVPIQHQTYVAFDVKNLEVGIECEVTPKWIEGAGLWVEVVNQLSSVKVWRVLENGQYPVLSTRKHDAKVLLKPNQSLIMAGLLDQQEKEVEKGVPVLKDLPLVGGWFKSKAKEKIETEIVFVLTPRF